MSQQTFVSLIGINFETKSNVHGEQILVLFDTPNNILNAFLKPTTNFKIFLASKDPSFTEISVDQKYRLRPTMWTPFDETMHHLTSISPLNYVNIAFSEIGSFNHPRHCDQIGQF